MVHMLLNIKIAFFVLCIGYIYDEYGRFSFFNA